MPDLFSFLLEKLALQVHLLPLVPLHLGHNGLQHELAGVFGRAESRDSPILRLTFHPFIQYTCNALSDLNQAAQLPDVLEVFPNRLEEGFLEAP